MTVALGLPVAADLDLIIGDSAQVSYTNGDGVNVRNGAGYNAGIVATLHEGTAVTIYDGPLTLDDGTSWYYVGADTTDGWIEGWVNADYLSNDAGAPVDDGSSDGPGPVAMDTVYTAVVAYTEGNGLNLRDGPSFDAAVLTVMPEGASVEVLGGEVYDGGGNAWSPVSFEA
jgi:uncharacterized protein YgiM (DUF1202 family)